MMRTRKLIIAIVLCVLSILLIAEVCFAMRWRIAHDSAILLYTGYLMREFQMVPYRDFFEQSVIGTFLLHYLLEFFTRNNAFFVRIVDTLLLAALLVNTYMILRKTDKMFAMFVCVLCGFAYFYFDYLISMEREIFIFVFALSSMTIYLYCSRVLLKLASVSLLLGLCITIKPHSGILYLVMLTMILGEECRKGRTWKFIILQVIFSGALFILPVTAMLIYLGVKGALPEFFDLALNYWMLYAHISKFDVYLTGWERVAYLVKEFLKFGNHTLLLIPAFLGFKYAKGKKHWESYLLILIFEAVFLIYPAVTGQFFSYHIFMFVYLLLVLSAFSVYPLFTEYSLGIPKTVIQCILSAFLVCYLVPVSFKNTVINPVNSSRLDRVDEFVGYLRREGVTRETTVQPMDWVAGGIVHAMFIAGVRPGTRFLQDFYFYHSVSHPYIRKLRNRFMCEMRKNKPDYIVKMLNNGKPWILGKDTDRKFPELEKFISNNYVSDVGTATYIIYKRIGI